MIVITGSSTIRPDHFEEALKLGVNHSARSRTEPGSQRSGDRIYQAAAIPFNLRAR